jgi:hypothetical protein
VFIVSGDVLVILDLRLDESLYEAGVAREVYFKLLRLTFNYVITHFNHCQEQNCRSSTSCITTRNLFHLERLQNCLFKLFHHIYHFVSVEYFSFSSYSDFEMETLKPLYESTY